MPDIEKIDQEADYAAGDPWTPNDMSQIAVHSQRFTEVALKTHRDDGTHLDLSVPIAYAEITNTGALTYTVSKGYNVATGVGNLNVPSVGLLEIKLDLTLQAEDLVGVEIGPGAMDEAVFGYIDHSSAANDTTHVVIQLVDHNLAAIDKSFGIAFYGIRSA
jgi:hypothetical protein